MRRGVVLVELSRFSATITGGGPQLREAIKLTGARSMWHPTKKHKTGGVQVPLGGDLNDVIAALEAVGLLVAVVDRAGNAVISTAVTVLTVGISSAEAFGTPAVAVAESRCCARGEIGGTG
jgi:hypothetical protein